MMILGVSQLGVMIFFFPSVYASALWFSLSIFLMMLSVGKYAVNLFQESSLNFLFLLFLWAAVGVLVRAEPYAVVSWIRLANLSMLVFLAVSLESSLRLGFIRVSWVYSFFLVGGLLSVAFIVMIWLSVDEPREYNWPWGVQPFLNVRHISFVLVPAWFSAVYFYIRSESAPVRFGLLLALALLLTTSFWLGGRGALVAIAFFTFLLFRVKEWRNRLFSIFWLLPLSLLLSAMFRVEHPSLGFMRALQRSGGAGSFDAQGAGDSGRFEMWSDLFRYMLENPLWGYGPDGFSFTSIGSESTVQPHNAVLQILGEFGWFGSFLCLFFIIFLCRALWRLFLLEDWRGHPAYVVSVLGAVSFSVLALLDGVLYHSQPSVVFIVFLVLVAFCDPSGPLDTDERVFPRFKIPRIIFSSIVALSVFGAIFFQGLSVIADNNEVPQPDSWRAAWVERWPLSVYASRIWLSEWRDNHSALAEAWMGWLPEVHRRPWLIYADIASEEANNGEKKKAVFYYREAIRNLPSSTYRAHNTYRDKIEQIDN
ncbi:O-antigen ligase family protein [Alloalcanivorax venustensis]|uniref:O-antigen ligase family protein n=1 Tax=Alloalcanivorax venustensis TaxID=172371 RepID=UPI00351414BC